MINNGHPWLGLVAALVAGCVQTPERSSASLQGVVELEETALGFELTGRLTELLVQEGDTVEVGALLARLDDRLEQRSRRVTQTEVVVARQQASAVKAGARSEEVRSLAARVEAARATEALLRKQAAREQALAEKGAVSLASLDDVSGQLARASAEREALEHNLRLLRQGARDEDVSVAEARADAATAALELEDARLVLHELRSPIRGTVLDVNSEQGEVVGAAAPVVVLADPTRPYVDVFVPQAAVSAVSLGQRAFVKVDALTHELSGSVEHIARRTEFTPRYLFSERERATLVVRVRVRVTDPRGELRAGVPAFVRWGGK